MIEEIKDTDGFRDPNTLKDILNMLIKKINGFEFELNNKFEDKIKEEAEKSLEESDKKDEGIEVQNEKIEEINIEKININKFVEAFPEYIKIESFSEEMENRQMIEKLIEIFKKIFGDKDKKIEEKELEIKNKEYTKEKDRLENNLKKLEEKIKGKEEELEIKNKEYSEEKKKLENSLKGLEEKIKGKEEELEIKNKEYSEEKKKLENSLKELGEKIKEKEKELEIKSKEYIKEKEKLEDSLKEKEVKTEQLIEKYIKIKKERDSMGDLLDARQLYNSYLEMEETIKSRFKNILLQKDFESFVSSGYSISTIDNIWDIVKVEYKNISSENLDKLRKIFKFFITQINKRFENPTYTLIEANLEEDFDPVTQFDLSQNSNGKVIEFIFYGYGTLEDKHNTDDKDIIDKIRKRPLVLTK